MSVNPLAIALVAAVLAAAAPAAGAEADPPPTARKPLPLRQMTCRDFLRLDDAAKPEIVYWAASRSQSGAPAGDAPDVDDTDRLVPVLVEQCRERPWAPFWQAVKAETDRLGKRL